MAWRGRSNRWESDDNNSRPPVWEKDIPKWEKRRSRSRSHEREISSRYDRHRHDRETNRDLERKNREYERDRHDRVKDRERYDKDRTYERDSNQRERGRESGRYERERERSGTRERERDKRSDDFRTSTSHDWSKYNYGRESPEITKNSSPIREVEMEDSFGSPETKEHSRGTTSTNINPGEWYCHCGALNFKRRYNCYIRGCHGVRPSSLDEDEDTDKNNPGISRKLILKRLDTLTNEEKVLTAIKERLPKIADKITGITISREKLTGISKGYGFVTFDSLTDSMDALQELTKLEPPFEIDDRDVSISYASEETSSKIKPAQNYQRQSTSSSYLSNIPETDRVNAAAAVAQTAIAAMRTNMWMSSSNTAPVFQTTLQPVKNPPTGDGVTIFPAPNVQTFLYDETSGYYYDPSTGLYYDGSTQYFYNASLSKYMYWDANKKVYVEASSVHQNSGDSSNTSATAKQEDEKKKKTDNQDKVKVAKKIAKEMEKWARTLNQKKESAKANIVLEQPRDLGPSKGSADIGFSVLGSKTNMPVLSTIVQVPPSPPPMTAEDFLVKNAAIDYEEGVFDWEKLTCLLCKRQFPSAEVLRKHRDMSELHKTNLAVHRNQVDDASSSSLSYRDRAAERRLKFGEVSPPKPKYRPQIPSYAPPVSVERVVDGIGSRMLEKMGWTEGKGLGKSEQGRTVPIEAERRPGTVGLGQKRGIYTAAPGETYRDTVKKLAIARYNDLVAEEK